MSFLITRQNIYSMLTNAISNTLQQESTNKLKNKLKNVKNNLKSVNSDDNSSLPPAMPTTLLNISLINIECGDETKCVECLQMFMDKQKLVPENVKMNNSEISTIKQNQCFGQCVCNIENVDLNTNLLFSVGYSIDGSDSNRVSSIYSSFTNTIFNSKTTQTTGGGDVDWLLVVTGVVTGGLSAQLQLSTGGIPFTTPKTLSNDVQQQLVKTIIQLSEVYNQTITQLLSSAQILEIKGTGIKVKNVSIKNIQNAVLTAIQSTDTNIVDGLNNISTSFVSEIQNNINNSFTDILTNVYTDNKILIWGCIILTVGFFILYIVLLYKKATKKVLTKKVLTEKVKI